MRLSSGVVIILQNIGNRKTLKIKKFLLHISLKEKKFKLKNFYLIFSLFTLSFLKALLLRLPS